MNRARWWIAVTASAMTLAGAYVVTSGGNGGGGTRPSALQATRGCEVTLTSPALEPGGLVNLRSGDSLAVTLTGRALRCPSALLSVYSRVGAGAETLLGTATTSAAGAWSYGPTAITDSATTVVRLEMVLDAGKSTSTAVTFVANSAAPSIVVASPAPDDWGRVRIVATAADAGCGSGGNSHADLGEPGWVYDQGCAAGGQVRPNITVTGGAPGTLSVRYLDAGLASVPITTSPQTFTATELGTWSLPDWTRDDLVIQADRQPDGGPAGGSTTRTLMARVATTTPPPLRAPDGGLGIASTIISNRSAAFDLAFILPAVPVEVGSSTISAAWTTSTRRAQSAVSRGTVTITTTPTPVADPPTAHRGNVVVTNAAIADAGFPVYCSTDPGVTPATGTEIVARNGGTSFTSGSSAFAWPDAGDPWNPCQGYPDPTPTVYCVTAGGTKDVTVSEGGMCAEVTKALLSDRNLSTAVEVCQMLDASEDPQVWTCADGKSYAPGEVYVVHLTRLPPLNTFSFEVEQSW